MKEPPAAADVPLIELPRRRSYSCRPRGSTPEPEARDADGAGPGTLDEPRSEPRDSPARPWPTGDGRESSSPRLAPWPGVSSHLGIPDPGAHDPWRDRRSRQRAIG